MHHARMVRAKDDVDAYHRCVGEIRFSGLFEVMSLESNSFIPIRSDRDAVRVFDEQNHKIVEITEPDLARHPLIPQEG